MRATLNEDRLVIDEIDGPDEAARLARVAIRAGLTDIALRTSMKGWVVVVRGGGDDAGFWLAALLAVVAHAAGKTPEALVDEWRSFATDELGWRE